MKKILFFSALVAVFMMQACAPGGYKKEEASTRNNLDCSFVFDSPVGYDIAYGVGFSGVIYENGMAKAKILWVPETLYTKINLVLVKDSSQVAKIYKGKCLYCSAASSPSLEDTAYFVYYVE